MRQYALILLLITMPYLIWHCDAYAINESNRNNSGIGASVNNISSLTHVNIGQTITKNEKGNSDHIVKLVHPDEIRLPTQDQFIAIVGVTGNPLIDATITSTTNGTPQDNKEMKTLTYTELYKLLAHWQLEQEKIYYKTQKIKGSNMDMEDAVDINENYAILRD